MHQRKGKKVVIYFFLLLLLGSINNINLYNSLTNKFVDVKVLGLGENENSILLQKIKNLNLNLNNIFFLNGKEIKKLIEANSLIEDFELFKRYPSSLDINLEKTKFLARINKNGKIFLVGSNGRFLEYHSSNIKLPFIFGKPDIKEFLDIKKIIDQSYIPYSEINNLYFFPSKRWDLELNNDIIVRLPKNQVKESLNLVYVLLKEGNIKDNKIIDLRIKNQIILND